MKPNVRHPLAESPYLQYLRRRLLISLALVTLLFALIYKVVPDARIPWRHAFAGGLMTAVLFTIGEHVIGVYLGHTNVGSAFGAAGSLIVVLVWIYYSAQIFFFGVELSESYAHELGSLKDVKTKKENKVLSTGVALRRSGADEGSRCGRRLAPHSSHRHVLR